MKVVYGKIKHIEAEKVCYCSEIHITSSRSVFPRPVEPFRKITSNSSVTTFFFFHLIIGIQHFGMKSEETALKLEKLSFDIGKFCGTK